jgi:hypothetical protein
MATAPVKEAEREHVEERRSDVSRARSRKKALEKRLERIEKDASKSEGAEFENLLQEAEEIRLEIGRIGYPVDPLFLADDVTPERLATLLSQQDERLTMASAEADGLMTALGRYSESPNLGCILKAWSGEGSRIDRVSRESVSLERPVLNMVLAVQPEALRKILSVEGFGGRGGADRFLYAVPKPLAGSRNVDPPSIPKEVVEEYRSRMKDLWRLPVLGKPIVLEFETSARNRLLEFKGELEPNLAEDGALGPVVGWGSKLTGHLARISGILHMGRFGESRGPVELLDVEAAVAIGYYLLPHAFRVLNGSEANPAKKLAHRIAGWIKRRGSGSFSTRDAARYNKVKERTDTRLTEEALELLRSHFHIRGSEGHWVVNPLLGYEDPPTATTATTA